MREDGKPREELLKYLDKLQNEIIRLKENEKHLEELKNIFVEAENLAHLGSWVWDIEDDILTLSTGLQHILGCEFDYPVSMNDLLSIAYHDDVSNISKRLKEALNNPDDVEHIVEHRFIHQSTGEIRYLKSYGRLVRNDDGRPIKMYGASQDITEHKLAAEKLLLMKNVVDSSVNAIAISDLGGYLTYVNPEFLKILNYDSEDEVIGKHASEFWQESEKVRGIIQELDEKGSWEGDLKHRCSDGSIVEVYASASQVTDESGNPTVLMASFIDITKSKHAQEKLRKSEKEKSIILDSTSELVAYQDTDCKVIWCNRATGDSVGTKPEDLVGCYCYKVWHQRETPCENCPVKRSIKTGKHEKDVITSPDGRIWQIKADPAKDLKGNIIGAIEVAENITDKVKAEEKTREYAEELKKINNELEERVVERTKDLKKAEELREKEIHHRVKNNLQVISSLLELQSSHFRDENVIKAFKESQNRVISMALAHENLYKSTDLENIKFDDYIMNLINYLVNVYQKDTTISTNIDIDDVYFNIDTIVPLGMIINELVSNSLKYAFYDVDYGEIRIELNRSDGNHTLVVEDNGCGLPDNFDFKNSDTLGLQLVNALVEQINGDIELDNSNGSKFIITFDVVN